MATPQNPIVMEDDNPWKDLKPADIFTDPGFHKLSKDARKIIASKVWKDFSSATPVDQDATLDAPITYWQEYFKPEVPKEPGMLEKVGQGALEMGKSFLHMYDNLPSSPLPDQFGQAPKIENLISKGKATRKPQNGGLIQAGNIDLTTRPVVDNADGTQSTVRSMSFEENGKEILVPTVSDDGRIMTPDEAIDTYRKTGKHLGIFSNAESATKYAKKLHEDYEQGRIKLKTPQKTQVDLSGIKVDLSKSPEIPELPPELKATQDLIPEVTTKVEFHKKLDQDLKDTKVRFGKPIGELQADIEDMDFSKAGEILDTLKSTGAELSVENTSALANATQGRQIQKIEMIGGVPYRTLLPKPVVPATARDIERENWQRIKEGKTPIPRSRGENAILSVLRGYAEGIPAQLKSAASIKHMIESGARETSTLPGYEPELPRLEDSWLWKVGQSIQDKIDAGLPVNPEFQNEFFASMIPQGVGSSLFFLTVGAAGQQLGIPSLPLTAATGATTMLGPSYEEAYMSGASPKQLRLAALTSIGLGATEAIPIERALNRFDKVTGGFVQRFLRDKMLSGGIKGGLQGFAEEFSQEFFQNLGQDWVSSYIDKDRPTNYKSDFKQGIAGGVAGAAFSALISAMGVANFRMRLRDTLSTQRDLLQTRMAESGADPEEIKTTLAVFQSKEKQFIRKMEAELDAAEKNADKKIEKYKGLTGTEAVMVIEPQTGKVIEIKSKEDYEKAKRAEAGLLDIPMDQIEQALSKGKDIPELREQAPGEVTPSTYQPSITSEDIVKLNSQIDEFAQGNRKAVIIPRGVDPVDRKAAIANAGAGSRVIWAHKGAVIYDPKKVSPEDAMEMLLNGREDELTALTVPPATMETPPPPEVATQPGQLPTPEAPEAAPAPAIAPVPEAVTVQPYGAGFRDSWTLQAKNGSRMTVSFGDDGTVRIDNVRAPGGDTSRTGVAAPLYEKLSEMMQQRGLPESAIETSVPVQAAQTLPEEMPPAPFSPEATPEAPPIPEGDNPFEWDQRLGFEANGAPVSAVGEFVLTPLGVGQIAEEDQDNPLPEGMVTVELGSQGKYDFATRDTIKLDNNHPSFDEDDYWLPDPPKGLKIAPESRYRGMNPKQVYLSLREQQASKLFALKRAEYSRDSSTLPGWRNSNYQYLNDEYQAGYQEISNTFGEKVAAKMRDDIEAPMDKALGTRKPPHILQGLPADITYVGEKKSDAGDVISYLYQDGKLLQDGASAETSTIEVRPDGNIEEAARSRRELYGEEKAARAAQEKELEKLQQEVDVFEINKSEIEDKFKRIRTLEANIANAEISAEERDDNLVALGRIRQEYEMSWEQIAAFLGADKASEERRKLEAKHPVPEPNVPQAKPITPTKITGPLSQLFESVATIDPKLFSALSSSLKKAEELDIADAILLGLIAGKNRDEIVRDLISNNKTGASLNIINLRQYVSAIRQIKGIPDSASPEFTAWQSNAQEILKMWEKTPKEEALPQEFPPAPVSEETEKPKRPVWEKKAVIKKGDKFWEVDYSGTSKEAEMRGLFNATQIPTAFDLSKPISEVWEFLRKSDSEVEFEIPIDKSKNKSLEDDGSSRFGYGVKVIKGKLQLPLSAAQRQDILDLPYDRAKSILLNRIFKASSMDPAIESDLKGILAAIEASHKNKADQNKPYDPISETPVIQPETEVEQGPVPTAIKENDALKAMRERLRNKVGARAQYEMASPEGKAPTVDEMLNDPEILEIMAGIGNEYYIAGVKDKSAWHISLYAELEDIAEGLGRDLEPLFGMTWSSVTGEETGYAGGVGGVYGAAQRDAEPKPGGVPTNAVATGMPHGGVQPAPVEGFGGLGPAPGLPGGEIQPGETGLPGGEEGGVVEPTSGGTGEPGTVSRTGDNARESGRFFRITPEVRFGEGGWAGKLEQNMDAVRLVVKLRQEGRMPTEEEKIVLARFIGWGALWRVFDPKNYQFSEQRRELRHLLTEEEYKRAASSIRHAYYTAESIARGLWKIADRLGFKGDGAILEGAAGVGVILGTAPDGIVNSSQFFGTELDPITAAITNYLYPAAKIFPRGFQELEFPDNSVDLAISNVPFDGKIFDKRYDSLSPAIHDYYFLKTVDKLRPGGILIYITSISTMDKQSDHIRRMLSDKADLVTAFRLPNGAFMSNAGTGVATDIIVLQKRKPGQLSNGENWTKSTRVKVTDKITGSDVDINMNEWYQMHPDNVMGTMARGHGLYPNSPIVVPPPNVADEHLNLTQWVADQIQEKLNLIPPGIYEESVESTPRQTVQFMERFADSSVWEKQIVIGEDGKLMRKVNGYLRPLEDELANVPDAVEMIKDLIGIREALWDVFRTQLSTNDEEPLKLAQAQLNTAYDNFLDKYRSGAKRGSKYLYLNDKKVKAVFGADPTYYFLVSLEERNQDDGSISKSPIFNERSMRPSMPLDSLPDDPRQALLMTYAHRGFLDLDLMASLTKRDRDEIEKELKSNKLIFTNPVTGNLELAEDYLSGDIYDKIESAEKGLPLDPTLQVNIDALKDVIPERVLINNPDDPKQVFEARLGTNWISDEIYEEFIRTIFENDNLEIEIGRSKAGGYTVKIKGNMSDYIRFRKWGTDRKPAEQLIALAMNQKKPVVYDEADDKLVRNPIKTKEAQLVQTKIREEFVRWARSGKYASELEEKYNRTFNRIRLRQYDGSHLTFDGMNRSILRHGALEPHQANAAWRIILDGRGMLAHFVGSGKTFSMAAAAMEMRQMGLVNKTMIAVPKNIYRQFGSDFARLYPGAKLLVVDAEDFKAANRKKLFARIAMEDWDAVVISHDQLAKIPMSPERTSRMINEEIDELEEAIREMGRPANKAQVTTLKNMQKRLDNYRAELQSLLNLRQDDTVYFDQMGVDNLMIDEAHAYKNLPILTSMGQIAGLGSGTAKRALALKAKTDFLLEKNNGRGVVFATGTPVSNSMVELYNFNKFLDPQGLRNAGVNRFDSWAANFGEVKLIVGIGPDGRNLRPQTVFGEFTNLTELQQMFRRYADVITKEMISLPVPEQINEKGEADKPTVVKIKPDQATEEYFEAIARRLEFIDKNPNHDKRIDNILKIMSDAGKASLDMRLVSGSAPDNPDSKANTCVRMMAEYYLEHPDDRRTQVAFTNLYQNAETGFNLYDDMKAKLIEAGVPAHHIAIIHDYKTDEDVKNLYKQIREGHVRILLTTKKTAEGANIQTRLGRLYHLDAPWTPKDIEQREGRIIRQGNLHHLWEEPVQIIQFVTERSLDSRLFEILRRKARFIRQYLKGDSNVRKASDPAARVVVTFEMISAEASGNPEYQVKVQLEQQVADLEILRERHYDNQRNLEIDLNRAESRAASAQKSATFLESAIEDFEKQREPFSFNLDGKDYTDPDEAIQSMRDKEKTGVPNPKIAEGKTLEAGEPELVPYRPFFSGRYGTIEDAIAKINYRSEPANRDFKFNAVVAGKRYEKLQDAVAALEEATKPYVNIPGISNIDFEVYGFPVKLSMSLVRYGAKEGQKGEVVENRWIKLAFLHENKNIDSVQSAVQSMVHSLHDMKRKVKLEHDRHAQATAEVQRIQEAIGIPWDQQEEYEELRNDLREVNSRLGLADPDEEGSIVTEEGGEAQDEDDGGDEVEDEDDGEYDSETGDHFYDIMTPYREISVPGTKENPSAQSLPFTEAQKPEESRVPKPEVKNLKQLPVEAEFGPQFLYSQAIDTVTSEALDKGLVPQSLIDNLKVKANRRLAKIQRVSPMPDAKGWEISDGITLLKVYKSVNGIDIYDAMSYGRIQIPELLWLVNEVTGNPLGLSKRLRTALGQFVPNDKGGLIEVRPDLAYELKDREQLARTLAHEIGHAIDFSPDNTMKKGNLLGRLLVLHRFMKQSYNLNGTTVRERELKTELQALSNYWRPWDEANAPQWFKKYRASSPELYADFLSAVLNSPGTAARLAPTMYRLWHQELDRKPEVKEAYVKLRLMMEGTREQLLDHRMKELAAMFNSSESIEMSLILGENTRAYSWWGGVRDEFDDRQWEIKQRTRKAMASGSYSPAEDNNPLYLWDELPSKVRTDSYRHMEKVVDLCIEPLKAVGLGWRDLNNYMFLHRVATERKDILNPVVGLGEYAFQSLEHMKTVLGADRYALVEKSARTYHDLRWDLVLAALASGIYSESMVKNVFEPSKYSYAKFTPIEFVKKWVSSHVQKQTGFAGRIALPFVETLKMDQNLIFLIARNNAVKSTIEFNKEFFPDEVKKAIRKDTGPVEGAPVYHEPPTGYDLVEVMENGKSVGYYVDQHIADSCNHTSPERVDKLTWVAQVFNRKFFWKIVILYNLGFGGWGNPIRDLSVNFGKLPLKISFVGDVFQLLAAYGKAIPHVWQWMQAKPSTKGWGWLGKVPGFKGQRDIIVNEMIDSYSFSMPLSDLMADEEDPFMVQLKNVGIYDEIGGINKKAAARYLYTGTRFLGAPMRFLTQFTEMTGKLAGYQIRKEAGEEGKQLAFNVRNFTSTPNYDVKGKYQSTTNAWFVFSTIMKEGWKSEYLCATDPKTRSGYWLRTSKLLLLKTFQVLAELGILNAIFGDDLKEKYKSASRYMKINYLIFPVTEIDGEGRVGFIPLPLDEKTRMLGAILRHTLILMKKYSPEEFDSFVKTIMSNIFPSVTPMVTTLGGWGQMLSGVNFLDGFRQTPVFSDAVQKARTMERWKRMVLWTLNENGLGQFATYDDSKQTWYQTVTQMDPTVGRLMGRMFKVTNYGRSEMERDDLAAIEREKIRITEEMKNTSPTVKRFYNEKIHILRQAKLVREYTARGDDPKKLSQEYPDAMWSKLYGKTADDMSKLQKAIELIEADKKLSDKEKRLKITLIHAQMDKIAENALVISGKLKVELPNEFGIPPDVD